nr:uncharacterized protein At4g38062-like [Ipomoea trifida]
MLIIPRPTPLACTLARRGQNRPPIPPFTVFIIFDSLALFISLAVVVVQTSVVVVERKAKKQMMAVINKLMWLACAFVLVAFLPLSYIVVGEEQKWLAIGVTVLGTFYHGCNPGNTLLLGDYAPNRGFKLEESQQIRISEGLQSRLQMCNQALAHEESRRKTLEVQLSESITSLDNVSAEYKEAKSRTESLTNQRDKEIANLRDALGTREAIYKETEYQFRKLEQENRELMTSFKEL